MIVSHSCSNFRPLAFIRKTKIESILNMLNFVCIGGIHIEFQMHMKFNMDATLLEEFNFCFPNENQGRKFDQE